MQVKNPSDLTLFEIINFHDSVQNTSVLAKSIGDGYLFKNNPLYQNVRLQFLKLGYIFTTEDFCHYTTMPFLSLPAILKFKKVPYFDNFTPVKMIEIEHPKKFKCEEIIKPKTNHTFHESSHCLAEEYIKNIPFKTDFISKEQTVTLKMIMAESFANSIESMANFWNLSAEQRLFYEMNSYIIHYKKINQALSDTVALVGYTHSFALIYISYLCSNCLMNEISPAQLNKLIMAYFTPDTAQAIMNNKCCLKLFNHAFELSMDFRLQTTGFYCQMAGLNSNIFKLVEIDLIKLLSQTQIVQRMLNQSQLLFPK